MNADGAVLGKPNGRTVEAFVAGAAPFEQQVDPELKRMMDLESKVAAGDEASRPELLLTRMRLRRLTSKEADKELSTLGDAVPESVAKAFVVERKQLESRELIRARPWERAAADRKLRAMYQAGFRPSGRNAFDVWERYATFAEKSKDLEMYGATVDAMHKLLGDLPEADAGDDAPPNAKLARQRIRMLRHQKSLAEVRASAEGGN